MSRYSGKPFLRLIECYVLAAIERLDDGQRIILERMEPNLREVYKVNGSWLEIVSSEMNFPEDLPLKIREIWNRNNKNSALNGSDPNDFAIAFVNQNFPDIVA